MAKEEKFTDIITLDYAIADITRALKESGFETPGLDALLIVAHVLNWEKERALAHRDEIFSEKQILMINESVTERLCGRPVAYITGKKEFYKNTFAVDERVLIPRGDTEILVEEALRIAGGMKGDISILDLGTGSGAIGLSMACELKNATVVLSDISAEALEVASQNAENLGLTGRVKLIESDLFDGLCGLKFDMILTNPPYISSDGMNALPPGIRQWEPYEALYGGSDGLSYYRSIFAHAPDYLNDGGIILAEIGEDQAVQVREIASGCGFNTIETLKDLAGLDRVISAKIG